MFETESRCSFGRAENDDVGVNPGGLASHNDLGSYPNLALGARPG